MADATPSWLGAAVTGGIAALTAIWALVRKVMSSVSREDMEAYIEKLEQRFEGKVNEVKATIVGLHEDNREARHRMRNDINAPLTNLAAGFEALRQELIRQRQSDAQRRLADARDKEAMQKAIEELQTPPEDER
jgi:hypothetical protein